MPITLPRIAWHCVKLGALSKSRTCSASSGPGWCGSAAYGRVTICRQPSDNTSDTMKELADSNGYYCYYKINRPSILSALVPLDCVFVFAVNRSLYHVKSTASRGPCWVVRPMECQTPDLVSPAYTDFPRDAHLTLVGYTSTSSRSIFSGCARPSRRRDMS